MTKTLFIELARFVITVVAATAGGGYMGYTAAMRTPVASQFAVVDTVALAKLVNQDLNVNLPSSRVAIREAGELVKSRFKDLTDAGMVVLDSSAILSAPADAFIDVNKILAPSTKADSNADQKPLR